MSTPAKDKTLIAMMAMAIVDDEQPSESYLPDFIKLLIIRDMFDQLITDDGSFADLSDADRKKMLDNMAAKQATLKHKLLESGVFDDEA